MPFERLINSNRSNAESRLTVSVDVTRPARNSRTRTVAWLEARWAVFQLTGGPGSEFAKNP
jgi:hypothetical protein